MLIKRKLLTQFFKGDSAKNQSGMSLIAVAFFIVVLGFFLVAGALFYDLWKTNHAAIETKQKLEYAQDALHAYLAKNGRYPCPAPLNADIDATGFGIEVTNDCLVGDHAGTFRANGADGKTVRTGALPVRTLNIPDEYTYDGYHHRLIYAVTEEYAVEGFYPPNDGQGDISIIDRSGNNATANEGNIIEIVYSMGWDSNGAYSISGQLIESCNTEVISGENCNFDMDATFLNTLNKSEGENNLFVQTISYPPNQSRMACSDLGVVPKNVAFLLDTSNSMRMYNGFCPMGGNCFRIHDAQWALRRAMLARLHVNQHESEPGTTSLTGFMPSMSYHGLDSVNFYMENTDLTFDDPSSPGYTPPTQEDALTNLNNRLGQMCPDGQTPLGDHIRALADQLGDGTPNRPNKIVVISDGENNLGSDPVAMAQEIHNIYPNLQIDIIDVVGTPSLEQISTITGGTYYRIEDSDELIESLNIAAGVCTGGGYSPSIPPAQDQNQC